jgi:hypothetical protein
MTAPDRDVDNDAQGKCRVLFNGALRPERNLPAQHAIVDFARTAAAQ